MDALQTHPLSIVGSIVQENPFYANGLTDREDQMLRLLAGGGTGQEIATELVVSVAYGLSIAT